MSRRPPWPSSVDGTGRGGPSEGPRCPACEGTTTGESELYTHPPCSRSSGDMDRAAATVSAVSPGDLIPCPRGLRGLQAAWVWVRRGRHGPVTLKEVWDERMGTGIGRLRERSRVGIGRLLVSPGAQSPGALGPLGTTGSAPRIKWRGLGSCFLVRLLQVPAICNCHSSFITGDLYMRVTWKCLDSSAQGPPPQILI